MVGLKAQQTFPWVSCLNALLSESLFSGPRSQTFLFRVSVFWPRCLPQAVRWPRAGGHGLSHPISHSYCMGRCEAPGGWGGDEMGWFISLQPKPDFCLCCSLMSPAPPPCCLLYALQTHWWPTALIPGETWHVLGVRRGKPGGPDGERDGHKVGGGEAAAEEGELVLCLCWGPI